jgi:tRNA-modifying protein YgfZ
MHGVASNTALDSLGVLRARGADAVSFLQGQLSNDLRLLTAESSLLAGYHNPQGRTIALLRLIELAPGEILAILPRELVGAVAARMSKYILRAKVKLSDESALWSIAGLVAAPGPATAPEQALLPAALNALTRTGGSITVRVGLEPARWLAIDPVEPAAGRAAAPGASAAPAAATPVAATTWERLAVAAGEPEVYAATSEEFVAQMLNLDVLGAIAFEKGCYTGQEVIARAHYRGRVKRRLQRFVTRVPQTLAAADAGQLADGRALKVVRAVQRPDGTSEFLAVAALILAPPAAGESGAGPESARIDAEPLALPYTLPE